jgi:dihydropteroate synthase
MNVKRIKFEKQNDLISILKKIGVSSKGIGAMYKKGTSCNILIQNVVTGAANILKQEMLALGADLAMSAGIVEGTKKHTDILLLGTRDKIEKLCEKLNNYHIFYLPQIKIEIERILYPTKRDNFKIGNQSIDLSSTKIMGILNVTPDSFSDGMKYLQEKEAIKHCLEMIENGADIIDVGGESSRPGATPISLEEELNRVIPIIKAIRKVSDIPISVDTYKSVVAEQAILAGASIINDISGLRFDEKMTDVLRKYPDIPIIIMHMKGSPKNMQNNPTYQNVIDELIEFFYERLSFCRTHRISKSRIIIDPGIGFGKRLEDNLKIIKNIYQFKLLDLPVLLGASRKSFIGQIYESTPEEREVGTLATTAIAVQNEIEFVRVHDVKANNQLIKTLNAINNK